MLEIRILVIKKLYFPQNLMLSASGLGFLLMAPY